MSMATRTETQWPALHVADSHDLIRVQGASENNPMILRGARGAHRYSPKCPEKEEFSEVRGYKVHPHSPGPVAIEPLSDLFGPQTGSWWIHS